MVPFGIGGVPFGGVPEAAAARKFEDEAPSGRYTLLSLGVEGGAVIEVDAAGRPVPAALSAACRVDNPVEHAAEVEVVALGGSEFDDLAEAPAVASVAAGAGS